MNRALVTAPVNPVLTTAEVKAHLRIDGADEDTYLDNLRDAAVAWVEQYLDRQLITQTWDVSLDEFDGAIEIDRLYPVQSVVSVKYIDAADVEQTVAGSNYYVDALAYPVMIKPVNTWPGTHERPNAVTVRLTVGYGDNASDVPEPIRQAALLLIGHWDAHREAVVVGTITAQVPMAVEMLLGPYRLITV